MCNRYRPTDVVRIRDVFGFTYIESGPHADPMQAVPLPRDVN